MRKIVYYVASSIDGFISGLNDNINGFVREGDGIERYLNDLATYDTVIMGKKTYEFGYKYGLKPGQPAYPHMTHYIFSNNLTFDNQEEKVQVKKIKLEEIEKIKQQKGSDIYLCGGGHFAGWPLDNQQIDVLKIKLNPLILGQGIKIFGDSKKEIRTELIDTANYDGGLQIMTFIIKY